MRIVLLGMLMLLAGAGRAFDVGPDFQWPSNYELVQQAECIILVHAMAADEKEQQVTFSVVEVLKGEYREPTLTYYGTTDPKYYNGRSVRGDFSRGRPGTYSGAGEAYDFKIGEQYLFLLPTKKLSRSQEEVTDDDPWIQVVRQYLHISTLRNYAKEKRALRSLRAKAAKGRDPARYPPGLVADIDQHFDNPYPTKSYDDLLAIYNQAKDNRMSALYAMAQGNYREALPLIRQAAKAQQLNYPTLARYLAVVDDDTLRDTVVQQLAELLKASKDGQESFSELLAPLARQRHNALLLPVLQQVNLDAAAKLAPWYMQYARKEALPILSAKLDGNYRERWGHLSFIIANLGDEKIVDWALTELAPEKALIPGDAFGPLLMLASSPLPRADARLGMLVNTTDQKLLSYIINSLVTEDCVCPHRWQYLRQIATRPDKSPGVVADLKSLSNINAPEAKEILALL